MVDVTEILVHWHAGRSISEVSTSLNVDRKTIRRYLAPAVAAGLTPGGPAMGQADWAALVLGWFPHLVDTSLRQVTWPEIATHYDYIVDQLKAGVTQATIHQRLRDERGLRASLASLKRYVAANLAEEVRRDQVVVLRDPVPAGEEAQIDYGHMGWWVDPATGRPRRRCSPRSKPRRWRRCRPDRSCWPPGRHRGSGRISTPRWARRSTPCRGV